MINSKLSIKIPPLLLVMSLCMIIYLPITYSIVFMEEKKLLEEKIELIENAEDHYVGRFSVYMDNKDKESILNAVEELLRFQFIHSVTIVDHNRETLCFMESIDPKKVSYSYERKELPIKTKGETASLILFYQMPEQKYVPISKSIVISILLSMITYLFIIYYTWLLKKSLRSILVSFDEISNDKICTFKGNSKLIEVDEIEKKLCDLSEKIHQDKNEQAERENILEIKQNVLQIAAHELRTPITRIKTYLNMCAKLTEKGQVVELKSLLNQSFSDVNTLDKHITAILALSALQKGELDLNLSWVCLRELFKTINEHYSFKCQSKAKVKWILDLDEIPNREVLIDYDLLYIIVSNAIDNAIKFTNVGSVQVFVELNKQLCITISDSGSGMSDEEVNTLKKLHTSLENTINRSKDGWGIGLATMCKFSQFLGGKLDIDTKKGLGTKVTICLPVEIRSKNVVEKRQVKLAETVTVNNITDSENKIKVLIMDNDKTYLDQMKLLFSKEMLNREDVQVAYCGAIIDFVCMVEEHEYDLMLIDYHMPEKNGISLLQFVNEQNMSKSAVKVIVTADANISETNKKQIQKYGASILSKGLTISDVKNLLRKVTMKTVS